MDIFCILSFTFRLFAILSMYSIFYKLSMNRKPLFKVIQASHEQTEFPLFLRQLLQLMQAKQRTKHPMTTRRNNGEMASNVGTKEILDKERAYTTE